MTALTRVHETRVYRAGAWYRASCSCGASPETPRAKDVVETWARQHKEFWRRLWEREDAQR